jgi:hypothetical protein
MTSPPVNTFPIGVFGQPASAAAKFAAEGVNCAYLYESESGATKLETWANAWLNAGASLILQDFAYDKLLAVPNFPFDRILGVVPGPIGTAGKPTYDEPERAGVTTASLAGLCDRLRAAYPALPPLHMNFQGDRITSGPPNASPVAGSTLVNKGEYPAWFAPLDFAGGDWHLAARNYPVALLVTMFERMESWGAKRLYAMLECGPQTASDTPRTITSGEIVCQAMIAAAMNAERVVWFVTREGHPTRGSFSFDPRNDDQKYGCVKANAFLKELDPSPVGTPQHFGVVMVKDKNTGLQVRDTAAGWIVQNVRRHAGVLKTISVNVSMTRTINLPDGTPLAPMGFLVTPVDQPAPGPTDPPPDDKDAQIADLLRQVADAEKRTADTAAQLAAALKDLGDANVRLKALAQLQADFVSVAERMGLATRPAD